MPTIKSSQNGNVTQIEELRRRRKLRKLRNVIVAVVALILLGLYASGIYGKGLIVLGDLVDSARIGLQPAQGFPQKTGIAEPLQIESLAGGFVELGDKDLVVFSANGNQLRSIAHNYARPAMSSGNTRFVIYNRSGYELRVESRSRTLYTHTYAQPLLLAEMSANGSLAVVTSSSRYAAECTVYNPSFESIYSWKLTDKEGMPNSIAFAQDNKRFAVACLKAENGQLITNLYFLDVRKDNIISSVQQVNGRVLQMKWIDVNSLMVIYNNQTVVYNAKTGEQQATYSYGGNTIKSASIGGKNVALLFQQSIADAPVDLVILDQKMQVTGSASVPSPANQVVCTSSGVYVLRETSVAAYDLLGQSSWEMSLDTKPLAVLDAKKLLVFEGGSVSELKKPADQSTTS